MARDRRISGLQATAMSGESEIERGPIRVDYCAQGQEIANLEAMKMENAILAPFEGRIVEICTKLNDTVQEGQLLFVIEKQ